MASFDSYAECVPPPVGPFALAYNRTDSAQITALGRPVTVGTTTLRIDGSDLGRPGIGPSTLTVVVDSQQIPPVQNRDDKAVAWLDIDASRKLNDTSGTQVYDGKISWVRLGEVQVSCAAVNPTSPPPTSPPPTTPPPTSADDAGRTHSDEQHQLGDTPTPTSAKPTTAKPKPSPSGTTSTAVPGSVRGGSGGNAGAPGGTLPDTGADGGPGLAIFGGLLVLAGTAAVMPASARRRRR